MSKFDLTSPIRRMSTSAKQIASKTVKHAIWHSLRHFHNASSWPMRVRSGPAKGTTLVLDVRRSGSYWLGNYDHWVLERIRIRDWLPVGGVAWDCGAFVGYYAAIFRTVVGEAGRVIAFEASTSNFEPLRQMPDLNGWTNVEIVHGAVGAEHTVIDFAGELGGASGPLDTKTFDHPVITERVRCSGMDELCFELGMPLPDFVKLDLEGAEVHALHNGARVFTQKRPVVLLELHGTLAVSALGEFLAKYNYHAWDVRDFNQLQCAPFTSKAALMQAEAELCHMMVCLPAELAAKRSGLIASASTK